MRFDVVCPQCETWIAHCPTRQEADVIAERHNNIVKGDHRVTVQKILQTPWEGLL